MPPALALFRPRRQERLLLVEGHQVTDGVLPNEVVMFPLARSPEIAPAIGARKPWRRQAAQRFAQGLPP